MSTVDSNQSLNNILDKLGIQPQEQKKRADGGALGQEDFLKLMTTQLQNQDPFAPMENADFIAQMAQFSTVTGITDMGQSLKGISNQLSEFRIATATNLLGNSVLVPGSQAYPDADGAVHGVVDLPAASGMTNVAFTSQNGEILHIEELGAQSSGLTGFSWENIPQDILDRNARIKIEALIDTGNGPEQLSPSIYSKVISASVGTGTEKQVLLNIEDYGDIDVSSAVNFR